MAYPTAGIEAKFVSFGASGGLYETITSKLRAIGCSLSLVNEAVDDTGLDFNTAATLPGLKTWSVQISALAKAAPSIAYNSSLSLSGAHYDIRVRNFDWVWETASVLDITELPASGSAVEWKLMRPDFTRISGGFECLVDSVTPLTDGTAAGAAPPTLTLGYAAGTTANLAGAAVMTAAPSVNARVGSINTARYSFTGDGNWAASGASSVFGAVTFGRIPWSDSGTLNPIVLATLAGARTITGADAFLKRLRISADAPGGLVRLDWDIQGSGAVVFA